MHVLFVEYLPAMQSRQTDAVDSEYFPKKQLMQDDAIVCEYFPAMQFEHSVNAL